ncbi:MAG: hypothetical protein ORN25_08590 [Caulobacteraceae bacterium]|nr:hypothetical protein [Caulobacteraceae bacterium]
MTYDLLSEPLIGTNIGPLSLPELLAAMKRHEISDFPAMRPHQRPAWHMFLVQLAVLALDAAGLTMVPSDEASWRMALRSLTPAFPNDEPWHLVVEDGTKPAFLQPPEPAGGVKSVRVTTPDSLDMLVTARNHDLKQDVMRDARAGDWLFALVSLQTMEGYGGRGNFGIARMNGGSSSRPLIGLAPCIYGTAEVDHSRWWGRDVGILRGHRSRGLLGKALLWVEPWPEGHQLQLDQLDPLFIEVCRRIRLDAADDRLSGRTANSNAARTAAKDANGNTGDPWTPVHISEAKSLTIGEQTWSCEFLTQILFSGAKATWKVPLLAHPNGDEVDRPMLLIAEAIGRGNSKTFGFQSRIIPLPKMAMPTLFGQRQAEIADGILEDIALAERALRDGLALVAAGGDLEKRKKPQYERTIPARRRLNAAADNLFFPQLWARAASTSDDDLRVLRHTFLQDLAQLTRDEFDATAPSIPCASARRPRAEVLGRSALDRSLRIALKKYSNEPLQIRETRHDQ